MTVWRHGRLRLVCRLRHCPTNAASQGMAEPCGICPSRVGQEEKDCAASRCLHHRPETATITGAIRQTTPQMPQLPSDQSWKVEGLATRGNPMRQPPRFIRSDDTLSATAIPWPGVLTVASSGPGKTGQVAIKSSIPRDSNSLACLSEIPSSVMKVCTRSRSPSRVKDGLLILVASATRTTCCAARIIACFS